MMMRHFGLDDVEGLIPALNVCHLHWPWKNIAPRGLENVREKDVFVVQPFTTPVGDTILELFIILDALRSASARRITAVIP